MEDLRCVIFDLDGTLLDTSPGILESVAYATESFGYPPLSQEQLLSFIGPPLNDSFQRCYGCEWEEAAKLTAAYREYYPKGAMLRAEPYEGIFDVCRSLRSRDIVLAVATCKPQQFSERILQHFGFDRYLSVIHGADMEGRLTKADLIRLCVDDAEARAEQCVMVGDTEHDAKGAFEAGVPFLAVSYGFGHREEMLKYPNIGVAGTATEILEIIA